MRSIPEKSVETIILTEAFAKLQPGEVLPKQQIAELCGRPWSDKLRGYIHSAIRASRKEGVIVEAVYKVGYKRLKNDEIVTASSAWISRGRKAFKRVGDKLQSVDYSALSNDAKINHNARLSVVMAVGSIASERQFDKVRKICANSMTKIALPVITKAIEGE